MLCQWAEPLLSNLTQVPKHSNAISIVQKGQDPQPSNHVNGRKVTFCSTVRLLVKIIHIQSSSERGFWHRHTQRYVCYARAREPCEKKGGNWSKRDYFCGNILQQKRKQDGLKRPQFRTWGEAEAVSGNAGWTNKIGLKRLQLTTSTGGVCWRKAKDE